MDRYQYSRLIREMRDAGVEELGVFYIGESFTCKWLPDAIAEAKKIGFPYVFLTTNGSAATPDRVEACMKAGLDSLKFSINFESPAAVEGSRPGQGAVLGRRHQQSEDGALSAGAGRLQDQALRLIDHVRWRAGREDASGDGRGHPQI